MGALLPAAGALMLAESLQGDALGVQIQPLLLEQEVPVDQVTVELGTVHAGERVSPLISTRQAPHIPVPSTMMLLRLTVTGRCSAYT